MQLGIVTGNVVSTVKTGKSEGLPLLIVSHVDENLQPTSRSVICTDTVNARHGEIVLTCSSSSSRFTEKTRGVCTDNTIVAIVDGVAMNKKYTYQKAH